MSAPEPGGPVDRHGRTARTRVERVNNGPRPLTEEQLAHAARMLEALLTAAAPFGVGMDDLDWVDDLPAVCVDVLHVTWERRESTGANFGDRPGPGAEHFG